MDGPAQEGEVYSKLTIGLFLLVLLGALLFGYFYYKGVVGVKKVFTAAEFIVIPRRGEVIQATGDPAQGVLDEVFLQGEILSAPFLDKNGEDYLLPIQLPKKVSGNAGKANLYLGKTVTLFDFRV